LSRVPRPPQRTKTGTSLGVNPPSRFGELKIEGDSVVEFDEKPQIRDHWVNGGFFVFEPAFLDYLEEDSALENSPLRRLAADRQLHAFRHTGFWDCMDTYKDTLLLNELWHRGEAPWRPLVEA
jgi:glucose-1-phosphate cytidylyltransferase